MKQWNRLEHRETDHMPAIVQPLRQRDADNILTWRYPPPYICYNPQPDDWLWLLDPDCHYYGLRNTQDTLLACCCLGREARVLGGDYASETALDVGLALRPDLLGQGQGAGLLQSVLAFARQTYQPALFRVTLAAFNHASLRLCSRAGFWQVRTFSSPIHKRGVYATEYMQMLRLGGAD